jgi:hypothetical protein
MQIDRPGSAPPNGNTMAFDVTGSQKRIRLFCAALLALLLQGAPALAAPSVLMLELGRREFSEGIEVDHATALRFATLAAAEDDFRARLDGPNAGVEKSTHLAALDGYDLVGLVGRQTTPSPRRTASALVAMDKHSGVARTLLQVITDEGFAAARRGEYFVSPAGPLFRLPVRLDGTGALNRDLYFVWRDDRLIEIDAESWLRTFRLEPLGFSAGAGIRKGVVINPVDFSARVEVWLEADANCCPSGGAVDVLLELCGKALVVKRAIRRPASGS